MNLGIVVPCFNEADRWVDAYWRDVLTIPRVRWLFVDDGSRDETPALLEHLTANTEHAFLQLPRNVGKSEAVRNGLLALAVDECLDGVGFLDGDGAFAKDDIARMAEHFRERVIDGQDFDTVWSSRVALAGRHIARSTRRHYLGRIVATALSVGWVDIPYDTQAGLKIFAATDEFRTCLTQPMQTRWFVDMEFLVRWTVAAERPIRI